MFEVSAGATDEAGVEAALCEVAAAVCRVEVSASDVAAAEVEAIEVGATELETALAVLLSPAVVYPPRTPVKVGL